MADQKGESLDTAASTAGLFLYGWNATDDLKVPADLLTRERLSAARTYYVRTDGSDSNDGLTNTSGGAFLTLQKAVNVIQAIDLNAKTVTVQIADGTYTAGASVSVLTGNSNDVVFQGNSGTPGNVVINVTGGYPFFVGRGASITVKDLELRTTTSGDCMFAIDGGKINYQNVRFGACAGIHKQATGAGVIYALGNYSIVGGAVAHEHATNTGRIHNDLGHTVTLTGTPAFSAYFSGCGQGTATYLSVTYSGSATGARYTVNRNGVIDVNGAGASKLPGDSAGVAATGGQYL